MIMICVMLHNRATLLNLDVPDQVEEDEDAENVDDDDDNELEPNARKAARRAAGEAVRAQLIRNYLHKIQVVHPNNRFLIRLLSSLLFPGCGKAPL